MHNILRIYCTRHGIREETAIAYNNITVLLHEFLQKHSAKRLTKNINYSWCILRTMDQ